MFLIGSSCDGAVAGALGDPCGRGDGAGPVVTLLCPLVCVRCSRQQVQKVGRKITFLTSSPWHSMFLKFVVEISCAFCFTLAVGVHLHTHRRKGVSRVRFHVFPGRRGGRQGGLHIHVFLCESAPLLSRAAGTPWLLE